MIDHHDHYELWERWRRAMMRDRSLRPRSKIVVLEIADHIEHGYDLMSEGYLAASLARSVRTIQRAVRDAISAGWISRERCGPGHAYHVTAPDLFTQRIIVNQRRPRAEAQR